MKKKIKKKESKLSQEQIMNIYLDLCFAVMRTGLQHILEGKITVSPVEQIDLAIQEIEEQFNQAEAMKRV